MSDATVKLDMCRQCRRGNHDDCASDMCECPERAHPGRGAASTTRTAARPVEVAVPAPDVAEEATPPLVVWEEPPPPQPKGRAPGLIPDGVLAELRANPKRWAKAKVYRSKSGAWSASASIGKGKWPELPPAEWEAIGRVVGTGSVLYLRYMGVGE